MSAVASDELEALTTLKDTNGVITTSLENDLLVLREQHRNLTTDFEVQKTQLLETLLSKDRLMQDLASLKERTGTSENEIIENAKARSTKEAELEEVRSKTSSLAKSPSTLVERRVHQSNTSTQPYTNTSTLVAASQYSASHYC